MAWDPKIYLKFGAERTRPAGELLARIDADAPSRVADLGCGPGNSTALLAARWPSADIEGIDNSPEMLAEARASKIPARFIEADVSSWSPDARLRCDLFQRHVAMGERSREPSAAFDVVRFAGRIFSPFRCRAISPSRATR